MTLKPLSEAHDLNSEKRAKLLLISDLVWLDPNIIRKIEV